MFVLVIDYKSGVGMDVGDGEGTISKMNDELVELVLSSCVVELQEEEAEKEKEEELADEKVGFVFFSQKLPAHDSVLSVV